MFSVKLIAAHDGRRLRFLFLMTVLAPGVLLAAFAARALVQDRAFTTQQLQERLDNAADAAASELSIQIREGRDAIARLDPGGPNAAVATSSLLANAFREPGAGVVVFTTPRRRVWPERQLLYLPAGLIAEPPTHAVSDAIASAERIELRDRDYARAIATYVGLLRHAERSERMTVLHRLARTYRKAGREADALTTFAKMAGSSERVGSLQAGLIASFETRSPTLYAELVAGRWLLDQPRYQFYAEAARGWHPANSDADMRQLTNTAAAKERLTEAVQAVFERRSPRGYVMWPRPDRDSDEGSALIATEWLATNVWPQVFARTLREGFDVALAIDSGDAVFTSTHSETPTTMAAVRNAESPALRWQVRIWPRDTVAFGADLRRRQTAYLVMLVLVTTLLAVGTYMTVRVVRRELEVAQLKADFVSTVSHEFRSPLTGIRQLAELLARGRVANEARRNEYYERITRESERLTRLVDNLLDFARMEERRKDYKFEELDCSAWLRGVIADAAPRCASQGVTIRADIPNGLPTVHADREALTSAVHNLLDNAVKYSPGADSVWLHAQRTPTGVTIGVRDEGVGISDDDRPRVFDKFFRGRSAITREVKGAGLGLSLVRHIVTAHRGTVNCESRLGAGSTFSIHLPARV
jgi:signal transduction histidine kinase